MLCRSILDPRLHGSTVYTNTDIRCDSYNTAQIQLLSEPTGESISADGGLPAADSNNEPAEFLPEAVQTFSRGRSHVSITDASRSAASAYQTNLLDTHHINQLERQAVRSSSSAAIGRLALPESDTNESDDVIDTDDDVDFWGGGSPRQRVMGDDGPDSHRLGESPTDSDESDSMEGDIAVNDDDDDDLDDDDDDGMEIFGHR